MAFVWKVTIFNISLYKKYNAGTLDYQVMKQGMTPSNSPNLENQVQSIIEKKGADGWIRVSKCEKEYVNSNPDENSSTRRTKFYRWLIKVERKKVPGFQIIKFPNNLSYIGLTTSSPKKLDYLVTNDKKAAQRVSFSETFYINAFKKIDEICNLANGNKSRYASPDEALLELNSLIATLPRDLKEKIKPLQDLAISKATKQGRIPLQPKYYRGLVGMLSDEEDIPDKEFLNDCYSCVQELVKEVSSLLHESKDNLTLFGLNQTDCKTKGRPEVSG